MKILYISNEYPPETGFGGIGTYTRHMAEAMATRGHYVRVFCRAVDNTERESIENGVTVQRLCAGSFPLPAGKFFFPLRALLRRLLGHSLVTMAWSAEVKKALTELSTHNGPIDIIEYPECNAEGFDIAATAVAATTARLHTPWSLVRAYDSIREPLLDRMVADGRERRAVLRSTAVSAPSSAMVALQQASWNIHGVTVFPNPIPCSAYDRTSGSGWIYTGRVEQRKGVHVLIEGYGKLCREFSPPHLTLIGKPYGIMADGTVYEQYIEDLMKKLGLVEKITWVKGVAPDKVAGCLQQAGVAIFPSLWENFPYACLEAMASGCAVVASRCGGYPEMMTEGESGLLFEAGNSDSLAQTLSRLLCDPGLEHLLGERARAHAGRFDSAIVARQAEIFYQTVCAGRQQ